MLDKTKCSFKFSADSLGRYSSQLSFKSGQMVYSYLNHMLGLLISYLSVRGLIQRLETQFDLVLLRDRCH